MSVQKTKFDCVEKPLIKLFRAHGRLVAKYPKVFIAVPIIFTLICAGGAAFLRRETDIIKLLTPQHSQASKDQIKMRQEFSSVKEFDPNRRVDQDMVARVIITPKQGDNVWVHNFMDEIFLLDHEIRNFPVEFKGEPLTYKDVCIQTESGCFDNGLQLFEKSMKWNEGHMKVTYPFWKLETGSRSPVKIFLGHILGGVELDSDGYVSRANAMQLNYFLKFTEGTRRWTDAFEDELLKIHSYVAIDVKVWTFYSIEKELSKNTLRIVPYMFASGLLVTVFCVAATMLFDPVRSKPILGICGLTSAFLAIVTGAGFMLYLGVPYVDLAAAAPFLALGIGVDDMFVMLAAWRRTDHYLDVPERMSQTLADAGLSITITSLTDIVAICIGAMTHFEAVRIFCAFTTLILILDFVYQITFFAGCMVILGHREHDNRHAITCRTILPKSETGLAAVGRSSLYMACCAGGVSTKYINHPLDNSEVMIMVFFRDYFSKFLLKPTSKIIVSMLWALYICVSLWGCVTLKQGLPSSKLAADESQIARFYELEEPFFTYYSFKVQIVVHTIIENKYTADSIESLLTDLERSPFFHGAAYSESWLRDYQKYCNENFFAFYYSNLFKAHFFQFLKQPAYKKYKSDIVKVDTEYKIFRFLVMAKNVQDTSSEANVMQEARKISAFYPDLNVTVFTPRFIFTEQYVEVLPNMLTNFAIATASMFLIALFLIPHPAVAIYVTLSIMSICGGVIGFMSLWDVNLDITSMIIIIISIGFCVDYSAHITYAFVTSKQYDRHDRVQDALYALGLPIVQGCMTTALAVSVLANARNYIFTVFFKVIMLVSIFGLLHGLSVLPVLLSVVGPKGKHLETQLLHYRDIGVQTFQEEQMFYKDSDKSSAKAILSHGIEPETTV